MGEHVRKVLRQCCPGTCLLDLVTQTGAQLPICHLSKLTLLFVSNVRIASL